MQLEAKTIHYVEAEWFCKEVVKAICTEENKKILEAACKTGKIRPQWLNWCCWGLIANMHFKGEILNGDYFELQVLSDRDVNHAVKFSDSFAEGKLVRLMADSYLHLLKEVKSSAGSDKVLIAAPKGAF